jgi:glycerol-3-phosphate dehydrogenase
MRRYDVVVIGAGDVGTAVARELARFDLDLALVESAADVGAGTSKANTAILHTGFDARPGSLEARLVARGHRLLSELAREVGIPLERTGALLVAWDEVELGRLPEIKANAERNGYRCVIELRPDELYAREPHLGRGALGALAIPDEHIVCPWTPPLACAAQAVLSGADLIRGTRVVGLDRERAGWHVRLPDRGLRARWIVNAAGLHADEIDRLAGFDTFTVAPRRGELLVFDKLARPLVRHVLLPVPTPATKGVLVAPTVFGNVLVGPTAEDVDGKDATDTTAAGLSALRDACRRIVPRLLEHEVTATYAGLRAATESTDYQLRIEPDHVYACASGVRSTGLTSALAIAEWLADGLRGAGLALRERPGGLPAVTMPNLGERATRPYADAARIAADPDYGRIVCFCERVTRGEIRDACDSPVPPADLYGLRRRTRVLMGRCQGFFCASNVEATWRELRRGATDGVR